MKERLVKIAAAILLAFIPALAASCRGADEGAFSAPRGYDSAECARIAAFLGQKDENGMTNGEKISPEYDPADPATWLGKTSAGEDYGFVFSRVIWKNRLVSVALDTPEGDPALTGVLDLSGCRRLTYASAENNSFSSADFSGCSRLRELRIVSCGVRVLSVFDCVKLASVEAVGNPLMEFAFNRAPRMKFTHIYSMNSGTVGYIQKGGEAKLIAVPDDGHAFGGWYTEDAELISREPSFDASDVGGLIVAAKFRAPGPEAPVITVSNDRESGKPVIKWGKVPAAAYYSVARSEYKHIGYETLGISQGTSFIDKTAEPGAAYFYHVTAVNHLGSSEPSFAQDRTCDLAMPQVRLKHVADTGQNKLLWDKQPGAACYEVYRSSEKNGTYTLIASVTETSFVDPDPAPGLTYYYKLRALAQNSAADSAKTRAHSLTCDLPRPTVVLTRGDDGSVTLSWDTIDAAEGYEVFRSETEDGEYVSVAVTEETSFTEPAPETTVFYKVAALHTDPMANSAKSKRAAAEPIVPALPSDD